MFDFGWAEILLIATIALFVIGPKDIPAIAYQIGKALRRIRYMQYALTGQFDDFMQKTEAKMEPQSDQNLRQADLQDAPHEGAMTADEAKPDLTPAAEELDHDPHGEADDDMQYIKMTPMPTEGKGAQKNPATDNSPKNTDENNDKGGKN